MPVYNFGGVGGGTSLRVNAYESFPASAPTNTVGIITANAITSYTFSATEPSTPSEGMVWIRTGNASNTPIPIDARGTAYLFPVCAKQYISGAWSAIDSANVKCYQGAWKPWRAYAYCPSESPEEANILGFSNDYGTVTYDKTGILVRITSSYWTMCSSLPIDVTEYSKLCVEYANTATNNSKNWFFGLNTISDPGGRADYPNLGYETVLKNSTGLKAVFDISGISGNRYIRIKGIESGIFYWDIYSVYLEA